MTNIIIPIYHARATIRDSLDSLVAQTKKLFWVTMVNDCDGEDYSDIVEEYIRRGLHITWIQRDVNGGPGMARQDGINVSRDRFDYLMFLDADDMLMPRAVEVLTREAKSKGYDIVVSNFYEERSCADKLEYGKEVLNSTWMHGKIYKTDFLINNNICFLPEYFFNEDSYFNAVALNATKNKAKLSEITYLWRNNKNSVTRSVGHFNFIRDFTGGYIKGQVAALKKLEELGITLPCDYIVKLLQQLYNISMTLAGAHSDWTWCKDIEEMRLIPVVEETLKSKNFLKLMCLDARQGSYVEDTFIPYPQNILEWLNKYLCVPIFKTIGSNNET